MYIYTIKINSPNYTYIVSDIPKDGGGWMVIDKKNRQEYFYDLEKNSYEKKSGSRVSQSKNSDLKQQLNSALNKIGEKMNYQFKLF